MPDALVVLDGSTFFKSDCAGDTEGTGSDGFFFGDTRHLSQWQLEVDGSLTTALTSGNVDYYSARIVGVVDGVAIGDSPPLTVQRDRIVADGIHEDISVENHGDATRAVTVELRYGADFADLFEIRDSHVQSRSVSIEVEDSEVTFGYECDGFRRATRVAFSQAGDLDQHAARFHFELEPHARWEMCIEVSCIDGDVVHGPRAGHSAFGQLHPKMSLSLDEWIDDSPTIDCDVDSIAATYRRSLIDLAALRFTPLSEGHSLPAAGVPWFMAFLGRDALFTSYMALPFQPRLAAATLEALACLQASSDDPFRDAEPGKLPHELRFGELTAIGAKPHSPYYGSHDVTPLFLIVLDEYERWTGDRELVSRLEPAARAALGWIEGPGATDGYLYYRTRSSEGLINQCWKDSPDSIMFADGRLASPPLATCEIQGYAFDARRRTARLAREVWDDQELADRLDADATTLADRFDHDFWCDDRHHPALARDSDGRRVDSLASNIGHLLWSGIVRPDRASEIAVHLVGDDLFSGWGVRTLAASSVRYDPIHYHNGTVWPHDTALIAEGLRRYGFREEASRLAISMFDAAACFEHRLPELFAGFAREATTFPIEYANASSPQAWSAAAPLLGVRTMLGLDVTNGDLSVSPHLPDGVGRLFLGHIPVHGRRFDAA